MCFPSGLLELFFRSSRERIAMIYIFYARARGAILSAVFVLEFNERTSTVLRATAVPIKKTAACFFFE